MSNLTSLVALTFTMLRDVKSWPVILPLCFHYMYTILVLVFLSFLVHLEGDKIPIYLEKTK